MSKQVVPVLVLYDKIIDLVRQTKGTLNFHDALIALGCQKLGVYLIATFDKDCEQVAWLTRLANPEEVARGIDAS